MIDVVNSPVPGPPDDAELLIARIAAGDREAFSRFYDKCHILSEEDAALRASWLGLVQLCLREFELGLELLGIEAPERM